MMTPEEYQWTINLVKDRHHQFKLSFEQAEMVYRFEEERNLFSDEHSFSFWEEMDYELDNFQRILNEKQFKKYYSRYQDTLKKEEETMIATDLEQEKYITMYLEETRFFQERYIPMFYKELTSVFLTFAIPRYKMKVDYLRNMYKTVLDSHKVGIISSHYRYSKRLQPKTLEANLLRHQLYYLVPSYSVFKSKIDEPTRQIAELLTQDFDYIVDMHKEFFDKRQEELSLFMADLRSKYFSDFNEGWHVTITMTPEEIRKYNIMQVVLMDRKMFEG